MNGSPQTVAELNDLPVKTVNGATIYMRDVAHVRDGFSPQTNIVRANGQRGVLMSVYKTGSASTLDIVQRRQGSAAEHIAASLPRGAAASRMLFDQSLFVRASIQGVITRSADRRLPDGRHDPAVPRQLEEHADHRRFRFRSRSWSASSCLSALGETINIMTLGGLALAVGILVDDATVEIENINRNLAMGKETVQAHPRRRAADRRAGVCFHACASASCSCRCFSCPAWPGILFVPLAEAVVFAMLASYMWSRTHRADAWPCIC